MTNLLGLGVFAIGVITLIVGFDGFGFPAPSPISSRTLASSESIWLLVGGALAVFGGLLLVFRRNQTH